ncbi:hypothetical protein CLV67_11635 [Actinoplanes italicus]|uniref:Uncharacterized protein n=1 Tax=Actinoplanes italicus TaxID=113567 RepID=A0A2T0K334_9ACTN|nr:hypothetical protein CLV67_11635 [Actinoplanes italicus]
MTDGVRAAWTAYRAATSSREADEAARILVG